MDYVSDYTKITKVMKQDEISSALLTATYTEILNKMAFSVDPTDYKLTLTIVLEKGEE
jgi:hypothetical protein|tara:strand:+ start:1273 stop:1446 length:174 start_codon:yes stop_codon:yes gene_type:complete